MPSGGVRPAVIIWPASPIRFVNSHGRLGIAYIADLKIVIPESV